MGHLLPAAVGPPVSTVASREAWPQAAIDISTGLQLPSSYVYAYLRNSIRSKIICESHHFDVYFPKEEFCDILTKNMCGRAAYFDVRRMIVL